MLIEYVQVLMRSHSARLLMVRESSQENPVS